MSVHTANPYKHNDHLTVEEKDVLWEFAKLSEKIKRAANLAKSSAESPNEHLVNDLRVLERRMGLVLTLVQASVWAFIVDSQAAEESLQPSAQAAAYDTSRSWAGQDSLIP